jgi:hypothetical protein
MIDKINEVSNITVPSVPDIDAYILAYMSWFKELVGQNVVFSAILVALITFIVKKTATKTDDAIWEKIKAFFSWKSPIRLNRSGRSNKNGEKPNQKVNEEVIKVAKETE